MILKIKKRNRAHGSMSWFFTDATDIMNHQAEITCENANNYRQWCDGATDILIDPEGWNEKNFKPISFRWITFKDKFRKDRVALYCKEAYLLNDAGKTIERLN
jgi:hypothetical protein